MLVQGKPREKFVLGNTGFRLQLDVKALSLAGSSLGLVGVGS